MKWPAPRSWTQWARRCSQAVFLVLFIWLVLATRFRTEAEGRPPVEVFFDFDPLVMAATWLATYTIPAAALLALITLAVTVVLGRVFCGWICPFGTIHNMASWFRKRPTGPDVPPERKSRWQRSKYYLLAGLLAMAALGAHWVGIFDPFSILYRSLATGVIPGVQYTITELSTVIYRADPHIGSFHLTSVTEPVYEFFRDDIFVEDRQEFQAATLLFGVFAGLILLNLVRPRFWCRYICPLGAMLGMFAKRPGLRLHTDESLCNNCGRCSRACPAQAQPDVPGGWLPTECYACWNCVAACNFNGISFKMGVPLTRPHSDALDVSKRAMLASGAAGAAALLGMRLPPHAQARAKRPDLIRPPGARDETEFLARCIQCGLCMKVCPINALHPAMEEATLEGLWTPVLIPKRGYCEHNCNLCGQVCPTEAIEPLPLEEKQRVKIGLATVDTSRCIPYVYGRPCLVCEEHCPVSPKAIYLVEREVTLRSGATKSLQQPQVDPDRCIGCGICEWSCVYQDKAAIRVTSANESRHSGNQPIMPGASGFEVEKTEEGGGPGGSSGPYGAY